MEIKKYVVQKKELQKLFLSFIDNNEDIHYQALLEYFQNQNYPRNKYEFENVCQLILKIANDHHRNNGFMRKIEQIFVYFKDELIQTFSNSEIFNIFLNNKRILLFLFSQQIITVDESIEKQLFYMESPNGTKYRHFFYTELSNKGQIESELLDLDSDILTNFEEKRKIGENDSYVCQLIRDDSIENFVSHVSQTNLSPSSIIKPSIFETNSFLLQRPNTTLIEYASFFGSIQIFQFLRMQNVEMTPSLWLYSIHSNDAGMIHLLEENKVNPPNYSFADCLNEAVKCHHNEMANYFIDAKAIKNLVLENEYSSDESIVECAFHYCNYYYFPDDFKQSDVFYYLCQYNYQTLVNFFIDENKSDIEAKIIQNNFIFFIIFYNL